MADLGGTAIVPTAAAEGDLVKESTDASFVADVIQASRETPAIVVFWAPWCGPCKQLGPVLEKAVKAAGGAVRMVKVNVDQNQQVAAQLRVQSIPAVFAFFGGQPVDGFMGALPASEVKAFVKRLVELGGGTGLDEALDQAEQMLESGAAADAAQVFAAVLAEDPANGRALAGWRRPSSPPAMSPRPSSSWPGRCRRSRTTLPSSRPARPSNWPEQTQETGEEAELNALLAANPDDHQARFDLALALLARKDRKGAVAALLVLFLRDREWNDGAAKAQLFKMFDSFGPKDPLTLKGRRRLSSMIFA